MYQHKIFNALIKAAEKAGWVFERTTETGKLISSLQNTDTIPLVISPDRNGEFSPLTLLEVVESWLANANELQDVKPSERNGRLIDELNRLSDILFDALDKCGESKTSLQKKRVVEMYQQWRKENNWEKPNRATVNVEWKDPLASEKREMALTLGIGRDKKENILFNRLYWVPSLAESVSYMDADSLAPFRILSFIDFYKVNSFMHKVPLDYNQLSLLSCVLHEFKDYHREDKTTIREVMELEKHLSKHTDGDYFADTTYDIKESSYEKDSDSNRR